MSSRDEIEGVSIVASDCQHLQMNRKSMAEATEAYERLLADEVKRLGEQKCGHCGSALSCENCDTIY